MSEYKTIRVNDKFSELLATCLGMRKDIEFTHICNVAFGKAWFVITDVIREHMTSGEFRVNVPVELASRGNDENTRRIIASYMLSQKAKFKPYRLKEMEVKS